MSHSEGFELRHLPAETAAAVCARFPLDDATRAVLSEPGAQTPAGFVQALIERGLMAPAVDFLAHGLTLHVGVWWALLCIQNASDGILTAADRAACRAAMRWVLEPTEAIRAAAHLPAAACSHRTFAGAVGRAVALAGPATSSPRAAHEAVALAVKLACNATPDAVATQTPRRVVELGLRLAQGCFPAPSVRELEDV